MRLPRVVFVCLVFLAGAAWADEKAPAAGAKPESLKDRSSYAFGVNLVAVARQNGIELNEEYFVRGIRDALADKLVMTTDEIQTALKEQEQELEKRRKAEASAQGIKNKMEGDAFFAENTKREGVVTLPSGLQYKVMKEGSGPKPNETDRVKVHYRGKLLGGPEFDSSYERGEPSIVPLGDVIAGWKEALRLMPVGSQWKVWIPPQLAYGTEGKGGIGPNATVVFEVELLGIENAAAPGGSG